MAPRGKSRFEGSPRQVRGAIIRELVAGIATTESLARDTGFSQQEVEAAVIDLAIDDLVISDGEQHRLPA